MEVKQAKYLPVMRSDGSICGMMDHHSWVILYLVLSPVLIPGTVHSKSVAVFSEAFVFPVKRKDLDKI